MLFAATGNLVGGVWGGAVHAQGLKAPGRAGLRGSQVSSGRRGGLDTLIGSDPPMAGAAGQAPRRAPGPAGQNAACLMLIYSFLAGWKDLEDPFVPRARSGLAVPSLPAPGTGAWASECRLSALSSRVSPGAGSGAHTPCPPAAGSRQQGQGWATPMAPGIGGGGALTGSPLSPAGSKFHPVPGRAPREPPEANLPLEIRGAEPSCPQHGPPQAPYTGRSCNPVHQAWSGEPPPQSRISTCPLCNLRET